MNLKFSGKGLAFLAHFKADNDIRYYLNGIYLAPMPAEAGGGVIGAATNGHILGLWRDPDGTIERPVIARITKPLITACKKPDAYLTELDGRLAAVVTDAVNLSTGKVLGVKELHVQPNERTRPDGGPAWEVKGNFPDIAKTTSNYRYRPISEDPREPFFVNGAYLEAACKAFPRDSKFSGLMLNQQRRDEAVVISCPYTPEAFAIIMHMRKSNEVIEPPWIDRWQSAVSRTAAAMKAPRPAMPSDAAPPPEFRKVGTTKGSYPA